MNQIGFYHPCRGYWETTGWPADKYLEEYPKGWRQVRAKPGDNYKFDPDTDTWSYFAPGVTHSAVNIERDRRNSQNLVFQDVSYQADRTSRERVSRAVNTALARVMSGAKKGDLYWHGQGDKFSWIAADNTRVPMDAQTVISFGNELTAREGRLIAAANTLKAMDTIPADYATNESYWV